MFLPEAAGRGPPGGDPLQPLGLHPGGELPQGLQVHLFQLIQEYKAALRLQRPDDGGGHLQLVAAAHAVPGLALIGQFPILHGEAGEGQFRALQEIGLLLAYALQPGGQLVVLAAVRLGLRLGPGLVLVGAHLHVDGVDLLDAGL